ncbi:hypothetical protein EJB05_56703, partial [Eragrostis curvula]
MELGTPNSEVVNMTRAMEAVAPMLNHPRKTIVRVEVLVLGAAALLLLQFILGFCKRLWQNSIVSLVLKVCHKAMFPLVVYILSTMQASPIKNSVYPVWAVSLIIASEASGAVKRPDLLTMENAMSLVVEGARYCFYWITYSQLLEMVFGLYCSRNVAKWMKENLINVDQSDCSPKSMNDYNYLVRYAYRNGDVTTIDQIWACFQDSDDKKLLKDVCLSFALFQLLTRRYFGWICAEAGCRKTQDFVFKVLLPHPDDDYKRAFIIVETELGLCYDFHFTKYGQMYATGLRLPPWIIWFVFFLTKQMLIFSIGVYALKNSLILETKSPIIEVHSTKADYTIALAFLYMILMVNLLQIAFYLASDWFKILCIFDCIKELLPYDVADMKELEGTVTEEVGILAFCPSSEMYERMKHLPGTEEEDNPATIFAKGVKLGKQLEKWSNDNRAKPWKMLAEFWAESIIYITPSRHTAKHHMTHLESGGEFLTKIWVLLSHAGILNLDREKDQGPKPAEAETA